MPYSTPSSLPPLTLPVHSNGRPGHRRSFSNASSVNGAGAFQSLGALPRARITPTSSPPRFRIGSDDDDDDNDSDDASDSPLPSHPDTTLKVKLPQSTIQFPSVAVTSPASPNPPLIERSTTTSPAPFTPPIQPRPAVARTSSSPLILLSNGKPLKSSLKSRSPSSSSASLSTSSSTSSLNPASSAHTRAASAPNTPHLDSLPSPVFSDDDGGRTPSTPKNVHFAPPDSLRNVRVFSRSAKPAAISSPGLETETETEGTGTESERFNWTSGGITWGSGKGRRRWNDYGTAAFPFPKIPISADVMDVTGGADKKPVARFVLNPTTTTPIPAPYRDPSAHIHLESIKLLSTPPSSHPSTASTDVPFSSDFTPMGQPSPLADQGRVDLEGSILVRNISFEKSVYIRFTLDNWQTTSEVAARHVRSLTCLPPLPGMTTRQYAQSAPSAFQAGRVEWDRFEFKIPLSDYPRLQERTLWLVGRYVANGTEYWDNNRNDNYKVQFEKRVEDPVSNVPTLAESPSTLTGARQKHSLAPLVTVPLTLPTLPRSVRRRQVETADKDSDTEDYVPPKSADAPKVSTDTVNRDRSGSLTSPEAVQVMQNALGKLNLKNYARPRSVTSPSFFMPPPPRKEVKEEENTTPAPVPAPVPSKKDESTATLTGNEPGPSGSNASTPESSPVLSTPPLSRAGSDVNKEGPWPWGESTVTSPTSCDSNKGYAALLQQWCFATTADARDRVEVA